MDFLCANCLPIANIVFGLASFIVAILSVRRNRKWQYMFVEIFQGLAGLFFAIQYTLVLIYNPAIPSEMSLRYSLIRPGITLVLASTLASLLIKRNGHKRISRRQN